MNCGAFQNTAERSTFYLCWYLKTVPNRGARKQARSFNFEQKGKNVALLWQCQRFTHTYFEPFFINCKIGLPQIFVCRKPDTFIACFAVMTDGWSTAYQDVWDLHSSVECSNRLLWINQESCFLLLCTIWLYKHLAFLSCLDSDIAYRAAKLTCWKGRVCENVLSFT